MSKTYTVELSYQGETKVIQVPEDQHILKTAEDLGLDLPNSCTAGVCATCAAKILSGEVDQSEGMGLSPELQKQGYALLCISYPRSDLKIEAGKEDEVYDAQFGQPSAS
jgi:ferredoxin